MSTETKELWRIIQAREKSLVATRLFFEDWIRQEETKRRSVEADAETRGTRLQELEQRFTAEFASRQHWEQLFHEAAKQRDDLKRLWELEAAENAKTFKALRLELAAHHHWEELYRAAETQRDQERAARAQDAEARAKAIEWAQAAEAAKARWEQLFKEADQQREELRLIWEREAAERARVSELLGLEVAAHRHWEQLYREAETQRDQERTGRELEADAHRHWEQLYRDAEAQRDRERTGRELEAAERARVSELLGLEVAAHRHWEQLYREAETQRDQERTGRELEATSRRQAVEMAGAAEAAKAHWEGLFREAEKQRNDLALALEAAGAARDGALDLARREGEARQHWERLFGEAEAQRDGERVLLEKEAAARRDALEWAGAAEAAKAHWESLFHAAERSRHDLARNLEAAGAAQANALDLARREGEARRHWEELFREAEAQRDGERALREKEAAARQDALEWARAAEAAKAHWESLFHAAEKQRDELLQIRQQEAGEKLRVLELLRLEETARRHWEQRCLEEQARRVRADEALAALQGRVELLDSQAEKIRTELSHTAATCARQADELARLRAEQAQATAAATELARQLYQAVFSRDLAVEQARVDRSRRTLFGRWLAARNRIARWIRQVYCLVRWKPLVPRAAPAGPRIVQVNTHDIIGGAERTSYDLHVSYRQRGLQPTLVVGGKYGTDADVFKVPFRDADWKPARTWRDRWGLTEILYPTPVLGCFEWPHLRHADVVHIHNMHGHYWNSATLVPLGLQHPVVLTLHDEYTLSGDCCYTYGCERWMNSCGSCPQIGLERSARYALGGRDLTRLNVQIKRAIFHTPRAYPLVVVAPSRWLAERARRSPNLRHLPVLCINYGIDLDYWQPLPQEQARRALGLPLGKTIGLLVATHLSDRRKGFDCALEAIRLLPENTNLLFVIVGHITEEAKARLAGLPVIATGFVSEKIKMLNLFSAADFTFALSRVDNLPYMCIESLACGRPVLGSAVGGIPEIVDDPLLGWLTPLPFEYRPIADLLEQIDREPPEVRQGRFAACRRSALARFSLPLMVERHVALYGELLAASRQGRAPDFRKLEAGQNPPP